MRYSDTMKPRTWLVVALLHGFAGIACKAPNENFCCLTLSECASHGVDETRPCDDGLACKGNTCVAPSCSTEGCSASSPTCETATDTCVGCTDSVECARFADTRVCDANTGSCVECVTPMDCGNSEPVCESGSCRQCALDSECSSGACDDDGRCVDDTSISFAAPTGVDNADCSRSDPCRSIQSAVDKTSTTRRHVVVAAGAYTEAGGVLINAAHTSAPNVVLHGGGAVVTMTSAGSLSAGIPVTARDLEIVNPDGVGVTSPSSITLERVAVRAKAGMLVEGKATARDISIESTNIGIGLFEGTTLVLDRARVSGGSKGIVATGAAMTVEISNTLVYGTTLTAVELPSAAGSIEFSTIVYAGDDLAQVPHGLSCGSALTVRSSIVWHRGSDALRPAIGGGCALVSVIAGNHPIPNAMAVDPFFVDEPNSDFHLKSNSPAKDVVDVGPSQDFEGGVRPTGLRFDLGADETP
jgi:hypothetical protein